MVGTDADGDSVTATGSLTVTVDDDSPVAVTGGPAGVTNGPAPISGPFLLDLDGSLADNYGADGPGTVRFPDSIDGTDSGLTSSFQPIIYNRVDDHTLQGVAGGVVIFEITLDPPTATYRVDMDGTIDSTSDITFNPLTNNFVGGNSSWAGFVPNNEDATTDIDNDSLDLLLTPQVNGLDDGTINSNDFAGGVGGGPGQGSAVGATETFRVDFVVDLTGNPADGTGDYDRPANRDFDFDHHYTVNGAFALFKSTSGSSVRISAFDDDDGLSPTDPPNTLRAENDVGDGAMDVITGVSIVYRGVGYQGPGGENLMTASGTYTVNGREFVVTFNADGSVTVDNVEGDPGNSQVGTQIAVFTDDGFNSVEYEHVGGEPFQIGGFGGSSITTDPVTWGVPVEVVDFDGDVSGTAGLTITATTPTVSGAPSSAQTLAEFDGAAVQLLAANIDEAMPGASLVGASLSLALPHHGMARQAGVGAMAAAAVGLAMNHQLFEHDAHIELPIGDARFEAIGLQPIASPVAFEATPAPFEHAASLGTGMNLEFAPVVPDGATLSAQDVPDMPSLAVAGSALRGADQSFQYDGSDIEVTGLSASAVPLGDHTTGMEALLAMAETSAEAPASGAASDSHPAIADIAAEAEIDRLVEHFAEDITTIESAGSAGFDDMASLLAMQVEFDVGGLARQAVLPDAEIQVNTPTDV